ALKNFLSIYALTQSDNLQNNGTYEELNIVNGDVVRSALFGSGIQNSQQLIQNVWIGGDLVQTVNGVQTTTQKNEYQAMRAVLDRLGFNGNGLHNGTSPSHFNHFHIDIRAPQRLSLPKNLHIDEKNSNIAIKNQPQIYEINPSDSRITDEINMLA
ncbi:MAG: hypothetical protein NT020_12550, partial [Chloroflexales bacterium]|nr:hypothetical protein [Chloroflexales bacterium]